MFATRVACNVKRLVFIAAMLAGPFDFYEAEGAKFAFFGQGSGETSCISCHSRADGIAAQVVGLNARSSHSRLGCQACHAGDPREVDKAKAHAGNFVGKPDTSATLKMCAQCHDAALALFKEGKHFRQLRTQPSNPAATQLDCVTCHGAHSVGSAPETFSFVQLCAGCHGLEYLPALAKPVRDVVAVSDDLRAAVRTAQSNGQTLTPELAESRRTIRRKVSEIVHSTGLKGALDEIPKIIDEGRTLKDRIDQLKAKGER